MIEVTARWVQKFSKSREPLVTFGGKSTKIEDSPQDREARGLREFQVEEIAKVYGVPAPLVGVQVTEWGAGIEQLSKLFWRTGERLHIERFLAPFQNSLLLPGDRFHVNTIDFLTRRFGGDQGDDHGAPGRRAEGSGSHTGRVA